MVARAGAWLLAVALASPSAGAAPLYSQAWADIYARIATEELKFAAGVPLEQEIVLDSPYEYATAHLVRTDGSKIPYERAEAHIRIVSRHFQPLEIQVRQFRHLELTWVTDRILLIRRGLGHVAATEEMLDVVGRAWLSQQSIHYGNDEPPQ